MTNRYLGYTDVDAASADLETRFGEKQYALSYVSVASKPYLAPTNGATDARAAIATAAAAAAASTLFFPAGTYRIASNLTISCACMFAPGAVLKPDNGATVTLSGAILAGATHQLFDISTGGKIALSGVLSDVSPCWFGAKADYNYFTGLGTDNWAAFQATQDAFTDDVEGDRGGRITIPHGRFFLSQTWQFSRRFVVTGAGCGFQFYTAPTLLVFPKNTTGIRILSASETVGGISASQTSLRDFQVYCNDATTTSGHGIHASATPYIRNVIAQGFGLNGIHIKANAGILTGNANAWSVTDSMCLANKNVGLFVSDADANAGVATNVSCSNNGYCGIWDDSKLGNTYVQCLVESPFAAKCSYKTTVVGAANTFVNCYVEGAGAYGTEFIGQVLILGGVLDADGPYPFINIVGDGLGAKAIVNGVDGSGAITSILMTDFGELYTTATATVQGGSGTGGTLTPVITGGQIKSITIVNGGTGHVGGGNRTAQIHADGAGYRTDRVHSRNRRVGSTRQVDTIIGDKPNLTLSFQPVGEFGNPDSIDLGWNEDTGSFDTLLNGSPTNGSLRIIHPLTTTETGGRSAKLPGGSLEFTKGFWIGAGANARQVTNGNAMPNSGEWAQGDYVSNTAPTVLGGGGSHYVVRGWTRITSNSNNVLNTDWVEDRALTGT